MAAQSEIESKWTLSRDGFDVLLSRCHVVRCMDQLNVYFDHRWTLASIGATCRLRLVPHEAVVFTLKVPVKWGDDGTRESMEFEMPAHSAFDRQFSLFVSSFERARLTAPVREVLERFHVEYLRRVGWMRNTRRVLQLNSGEQFELDAFCLPGGEWCYEVEVEERDCERRSSLVTSIRRWVPTAFPSTASKFERFTAAARRRSSSTDLDAP
jgi:uncharacterized protein YjbK